jgi:hypothetical protein
MEGLELDIKRVFEEIQGSDEQKKYLCLWLLNETMLRCACILHESREETPQEWDEYIKIRNELTSKQKCEKRKKKEDRQSFSLDRSYCSQLKSQLLETKQASVKLDVLTLLIKYFDIKSRVSNYINHDLKALLGNLDFELEKLNQSDVIAHLKIRGYQL